MELFIQISFIFILGGSIGYLMELIFRRIVHKKWINPGFLTGPCLPLYGSGLLFLYLICSLDYSFISSTVLRTIFIIILITFMMTLIEYITGIIFIKRMNVKLWDYSSRPGNIQGIICPLFTFFWGVIGALYYFLLHPFIAQAALWISGHPLFSYFIGMYFGVFIVDICYSFHVVSKIKSWAKEHDIVVRYEELKESIKAKADRLKEKKHFVFSFKSKDSFIDLLNNYLAERKARK